MNAVVIGAGGTLGRHVVTQLEARGCTVAAVPRANARNRDAIARLGGEVIVDCAGASMQLGLKGWRGYGAVDTPIGLAAAAAARITGARMVYVAVHHPPAMRATPYIAAHERVVAALDDIDGCVVRATGFFAAFASFLPFARRGVLFDVGRGRTRTNPIDERDLAAIVAECAAEHRGHRGPREVSAGGPDVMTRRELLELVAAAADRRVRILGAPLWLARFGSVMLRPLHPRIAQLTAFACGLGANDVIAPTLGTRRLGDYLAGADRDAAVVIGGAGVGTVAANARDRTT